MKKQRILSTVLLAVASAGLMASSAKALSYSAGDLFLTFYTTGNGSSFDYVVDIGQASTYRDAFAPITLSINGINADLTAKFGADWKTRDDVSWGIFGATSNVAVGSDPAYTLYAGQAENPLGTAAIGYNTNTTTGQASVANKIKSLATNFVQNDSATANNPVGAIQTLPENNSFVSFLSNNGLTAFSAFNNSLGNFGAGTSGTAVDLFRMTPASSLGTTGPGSLEGTFTINDSGIVTFTPAAVPEPSTYGLVIGGGAVLLALSRRRKSRTA